MSPCWISRAESITRLQADAGGDFVVVAESGCFRVPAGLAALMPLLDGQTSLGEVSERYSRLTGQEVTEGELERIIVKELAPRALAQQAGSDLVAGAQPKKSTGLDFTWKVPLWSARQLSPVTSVLAKLFAPSFVLASLYVIIWAHFEFYSTPAAQRALSVEPGHLLLAYVIALVTVLCHELGHASACRRYSCAHEEIGFCLYLIFPAMYANLSRAWTLSSRKRLVIDCAGVYFQLLALLPILLLFFVWRPPGIANVVYSVDMMCLFSINPFLKCDGYWVLSDLVGISNLQRRSFRLMGDCYLALRSKKPWGSVLPKLRLHQLFVLVPYAAVLLLGMAIFIPTLVTRAPRFAVKFMTEIQAIQSAAGSGEPLVVLLHLRTLIALCLIFPFLIRLVTSLAGWLYPRSQTS